MKKTVALLLLSLTVPPARAGFFESKGSVGSTFLKIPTSARAIAMGSAFSTVSGDVSALDFNPAGLNRLQRIDAYTTYINYFQDTSLQSFSLAIPVKKAAFGVHYKSFSAEGDARDATFGITQYEFKIKDQSFAIGGALPIGDRLSLGVTGRRINQKLDNASLTNNTFDVGMQYQPAPKWHTGLSLLHSGPSKAFISEKDPPPTTLIGGVSWQTENLKLLTDVSYGRDKIARKSLGLEYALSRLLNVRAGSFHHTSFGFTAGLGFKFHGPKKTTLVEPERGVLSSSKQTESGIRKFKMNLITENLVRGYKEAALDLGKPVLAVIPFNSADRAAGDQISQEVYNGLEKSNQFLMVGSAVVSNVVEKLKGSQGLISQENALKAAEAVAAQIVLLGSVEESEGSYLITTRLIDVANKNIIASDFQEIAMEDFIASEKPEVPQPHKVEKPHPTAQNNQTLDFGLDYAFSTNLDAGASHTFSLRILY